MLGYLAPDLYAPPSSTSRGMAVDVKKRVPSVTTLVMVPVANVNSTACWCQRDGIMSCLLTVIFHGKLGRGTFADNLIPTHDS